MTTKGFRNLQLNERDFFLLKKIWEAFMNHSGTIRINLSELPFQEDWSMLSGTFNVLFSILKQNDNHRAEMIHLHGISGFSACHLLSRFALENQQIQQMLTEAAKREARETQGIAAEVVYCPQGNEADLLLRPVLRDYEIPVLAHSTLDTGHQILPADLMVSIKNGDIQLRSKQHHQPIIPFASHALDYRKCNLPLHRFLCELQTQHHGSGLLFEWGDLEKLFPFLPRIITGKTLLVPASWHFDYADLSRFIHPGKKEELKKMITRWRYRHKIPAKVLFAENDQELLLDLNSIAGIDLFLSLCRNKPDIHLKEFLMDQNLLVKSPEGQHLHEIIAPFYLETQQPNNADHE